MLSEVRKKNWPDYFTPLLKEIQHTAPCQIGAVTAALDSKLLRPEIPVAQTQHRLDLQLQPRYPQHPNTLRGTPTLQLTNLSNKCNNKEIIAFVPQWFHFR